MAWTLALNMSYGLVDECLPSMTHAFGTIRLRMIAALLIDQFICTIDKAIFEQFYYHIWPDMKNNKKQYKTTPYMRVVMMFVPGAEQSGNIYRYPPMDNVHHENTTTRCPAE